MTAPSHRAAAAPSGRLAVADQEAGSDRPQSKGAAPHGIWWMAWRQHRWQIVVLLAVVAAAAVSMVILRLRIVSVFAEFGCDLFPADPNDSGCIGADGYAVWPDYGFSTWSGLTHAGMIVGPVVLGVFAASPIFTREFAHGTQVFALTQSVSRRRWFAVKTALLAMPLAVGLLVLGLLMGWTDGVVSLTAHRSLDPVNFFARSLIPASTGLMAFGLALAIGMISRNVLAALIAGALIGGAVLLGLAIVQPHVLPASRTVTPLAETYAPVTQADIDAAAADSGARVVSDPDQYYLHAGYLNAAGDPIDVSNTADCYTTAELAANKATGVVLDKAAGYTTLADGTIVATAPPDIAGSPKYQTARNAAMLNCMTAQGIAASYQEYLPASTLWPLRWVMTGIVVVLAALFLGVSGWRLKSAVAKR